MSPVQPTHAPTVMVAIDIATFHHDVLFEAPEWKDRRRVVLPKIAAESRLFADFTHGLKHPLRVIFDAMKNYHRPLTHILQADGFYLELLALLALLAVAGPPEATHNS